MFHFNISSLANRNIYHISIQLIIAEGCSGLPALIINMIVRGSLDKMIKLLNKNVRNEKHSLSRSQKGPQINI